MQDTGRQFHIHCTAGDVGRYCILPGDPGRCQAIAQLFDRPVHVGMNREFNIYTGYLLGEKVSVCSTASAAPLPPLPWKSWPPSGRIPLFG